MRKIRQTLKAHISGMAWWIQLKFGIGGAPPRGNLHKKNLFREFQAYRYMKTAFSLLL